jgi:molybdopterin molybdotransferase
VSEFFSVRSVSDALAGFRPAHRTAVERAGLDRCGGRVAAADVAAPDPLPGFPRSAVDGYAVAARDTFGAGEGLPAYLDVVGAVEMGRLPELEVGAGGVAEIPTGGALPRGADAVVMVEHTALVRPGQIELTRPAAAGDNVTRAGEDAAAGDVVVRRGARLRPQDVGLLAAVGVVELEVHRRPLVGIISTGDEVVEAGVSRLRGAQVRDANSHALAALVTELGGEPLRLGIVPDEPERLAGLCERVLSEVDVLVISAGSSVGARDATARVVSGLGPPGIWCHGLALKPGKPTLLAEVRDRPVIGLPGNPVSALVVMRLIGGPLLGLVGGASGPARRRSVVARLTRNVPSMTGRYDVVQVALDDGNAVPLFGKASLLSAMTRADGFIAIPDEVQGLAAGSEVEVEPYA